MRQLLIVAAVVTVCLCNGHAQSSGCTTQLGSNDIVCGSEGDCTFYTPYGSPWGGMGYVCIPFTCGSCTSGLATCFLQGYCGFAKLEDPTIRKRLLDLSANQDLVVASCDGDLEPLDVVIRNQARQFVPTLLRRSLPLEQKAVRP